MEKLFLQHMQEGKWVEDKCVLGQCWADNQQDSLVQVQSWGKSENTKMSEDHCPK